MGEKGERTKPERWGAESICFLCCSNNQHNLRVPTLVPACFPKRHQRALLLYTTAARVPFRGCREAGLLPLPLQPALHSREGPETCPALGLPEEQTAGSVQSRQKLRCGPLGASHPRPRMWLILRNHAKPGCDSRRGCGFPAGVQGGGPRRCRAGGARVTRRLALPPGSRRPRPPAVRTCVRFTGPRGRAAPRRPPR